MAGMSAHRKCYFSTRSMSRIEATVNDLIGLDRVRYCDLGPGKGAISIGLRKQGRQVVAVEAHSRAWGRRARDFVPWLSWFNGKTQRAGADDRWSCRL